ncbi:MAG: methyltransferase domain-containing protein [Acetobacter sp.]|nr:methyltransferase domain-containing protein [Acetobacter sp.]
MHPYTNDYLLDKKVKIFQPIDGYRASTDAVFLSSLLDETKVKSGDTILDVGSGTGAISLCLAERLKEKNITITGVDIQTDLVELSNFSAKENGFADFLNYEYLDIREKTTLQSGSFSFVISNPPYSDHDMPSPNRSKQLAHNHQNFNLTSWLTFCLKMLKPQGYLLIINRTEAINEILAATHNKAGDIQILPMYSKEGQVAKRVAIIAKKGAKGITKILPPFYTHNTDGTYTLKAQHILRLGQGYFE